MKCNHCGSTWDTAVQIKTCPFCGKNLYENKDYTIASALTKVVKDSGFDILHDSRKITAYIMDYVKGNERDKKLLRIAGNAGVFDLLYDAKMNEDKAQQSLIIGKALKVLEEEAFLSSENAIHITEILAEGLSIEFARIDMDKSDNKNEYVVHKDDKSTVQIEQKTINLTVQAEKEEQRQSYQTKEAYLTMLVTGNKRVTKEENEEIY